MVAGALRREEREGGGSSDPTSPSPGPDWDQPEDADDTTIGTDGPGPDLDGPGPDLDGPGPDLDDGRD